MRDLRLKTTRPAVKNRLKKKRKPINYRGFFKKAVRLVGCILVVALLGLTGYEVNGVISKTTFMRLERIDVNPLKRLTRTEVISLAGVKPGDNMITLKLWRIGEQLSKNPWVEKVRVKRYFPHILTIEVTEREPVAVVNMGFLYYLDKNGEVFKPLIEGDRLDFPVLTGITEDDLARDQAGTREILKRARDLIALLSARKSVGMDDISEIHCERGFGFTLFTAQGGVPIKLGNNDFDGKLDRLAKIYPTLLQQMPMLAYIDLDYGDRIIVKKV